MKIISRLPEKENYLFTGQKNSWYVYEDIDCSIVRIYSRIRNPFNKEVCIMFSIQNGKTDESKCPCILVLKVFPVSPENTETPKATLVREHYKSKFSFRLGKGKVEKWFSFVSKPNFVLDYFYF